MLKPLYREYDPKGEYSEDTGPESKIACPYTWVVEYLKNELNDDRCSYGNYEGLKV